MIAVVDETASGMQVPCNSNGRKHLVVKVRAHDRCDAFRCPFLSFHVDKITNWHRVHVDRSPDTLAPTVMRIACAQLGLKTRPGIRWGTRAKPHGTNLNGFGLPCTGHLVLRMRKSPVPQSFCVQVHSTEFHGLRRNPVEIPG